MTIERALEDLEAWKKFDASGRKDGISLDEITPWLDSWGTDNELAPPSSMTRHTETRYFLEGKEQMLSLGIFPVVGLKDPTSE